VSAIFLKEVSLWLLGRDLEIRYGLPMALALLAFRLGVLAVGRGEGSRSTRYYCAGGILVALVFLARH
jgi:hypothetical protein